MMGITEALRAVWEIVRTQRLRAAVIVLCTAAGIAFLVGIVGAVHGIGAQLEHDVLGKLYGFNTVQVRRASGASDGIERESAVGIRDRHRRITIADAEWLEAHLPIDAVVAYSYGGAGRIRLGGARAGDGLSAQVLAASASQFAVQSLDVRMGRPFSEYEARRGASVVVLGAEVRRRLFGSRPPLQQIVSIQGIPFRVSGVLERRGKFLGFSMDNLVVVPARSRMNGIINQRDEVDAIAVRVAHDSLLSTTTAVVDGMMRVRRGLAASNEDDFDLTSSAMLMDAWGRIQRILLIAGPALVGVALLVAILVTTNVMLVVVTERVPEIGVRLAVGARRVDILRQFLAEATVLSGAGGMLGVALGAGAVAVLRIGTSMPASVTPGLASLGLVVSVIVGVAAGAYPAQRAAALTPIEALGRE
jgi:putative ABC transport system permease protein